MKTIYYGGVVYTGCEEFAEAFVVEDGLFGFVGSSAEVLALACDGDEKIDLGGAFVCPGFNDSHMHVLSLGQALTVAPLHMNTGSLEALLACFKEFIKNGVARNGWIMGRGWNQDYFTDVKRMPNRYDLDTVSTEYPVVAVRACGHAMVVNSKALEMLGITADTPSPEGGQIVKENGEPNGILFDNAMDMVYRAVPAPEMEDVKDMLRAAVRTLNSFGVTSAQSDDYCVLRNFPWQKVNEAFKELEESGELSVRIYEQSNFTSLEALNNFVESGNKTGVGSSLFKIGPLKMLGDGALGARTAYLSRPYADDPSTSGIPVFTKEVFDEMIGYANEQGMQVAVHTIGDACLDDVISAVDKALAENPKADHRHGIVHCQITRPDQLKRLCELNMHIYAQSIFLDYDINIVSARVGEELASSSYSWKTLLDGGCSVSNGTDCPVEMPFALGGIQCAVTRCNLAGNVGPYLPEQAFTVKEALDSYTKAGAFSSFEENVKGSIRSGMYADFVVLGGNPFEVDKFAIKDIPVLSTYLGGSKVYEA